MPFPPRRASATVVGRLLPTEAPLPGARPAGQVAALSVAELINRWDVPSYSGFVVGTGFHGCRQGPGHGDRRHGHAAGARWAAAAGSAGQLDERLLRGGMGGVRRLRHLPLVAAGGRRLPPRPGGRRRRRRRSPRRCRSTAARVAARQARQARQNLIPPTQTAPTRPHPATHPTQRGSPRDRQRSRPFHRAPAPGQAPLRRNAHPDPLRPDVLQDHLLHHRHHAVAALRGDGAALRLQLVPVRRRHQYADRGDLRARPGAGRTLGDRRA